MSVSDGEKATAATFNSSFISRDTDSNTTAKIDLEDADVLSGASIINTQKSLNAQGSFTGAPVNGAQGQLPTWTNNDVGISTDDVKTRADSLTAQVGTNVTDIATNVSDIAANTSDVADIRTLSGTSDGETDLGTFTGAIITDNVDIKVALQEVETALETITDALDFQGTWNATTNTPALVSSTGTKGHTYVVATAGTTTLDGISDWAIGDWVVFDGTVWRKIDNTEAISDTDDVPEGVTNLYYTNTRADARIALAVIDALADVDTTTAAPTDGQVLTWDNAGSNWVPDDAGAGSGVGGINYITNFDAEVDTTGWATYDDGAVAAPVDGTAGSPSAITFNRTTTASEILRGSASFEIAKTAADGQGEGASFDLSIDPRDEGSELFLTFDYKNSANYVSGDIRLFVYDVTNAALISVRNDQDADILSHTGEGSTFQAQFTATDSNSYRLIFHVTTVNANVYDAFIDNVRLGPTQPLPTGIITEWESCTLAGTWTTNTSYAGKCRRVGDSLEIEGDITLSGAPDTATLDITLPNSLQVDQTKINDIDEASVGHAFLNDSSTAANRTMGKVNPNDATTIRFLSIGSSVVNATQPFTWAANDRIWFKATIPIEGWGAGALLSTNESNQQTISARYDVSVSTANSSFADAAAEVVDFDTLVFDTHNAVTTGASWVFTAPRAGKYEIRAAIKWSSSSNHVATNFDLRVSTAFNTRLDRIVGTHISVNGDTIVELLKGDTIDVTATQDDSGGAARSLDTAAGIGYITIKSLPDFQSFSRFAESPRSMVRIHTGNGFGSTNTVIRRFTTIIDNFGSAITYSDSAANGASFTINEDGAYAISYTDREAGGGANFGISLNSSQLTTSINSITAADRLINSGAQSGAEQQTVSWTGVLSADDVIRAHTDAATDDSALNNFTIVKVSN